MSLMTTWGYTIKDASALGQLISLDDFNTATAGKYIGDMRAPEVLRAASMGIRNYCGWHVYPEHVCIYSERLLMGNGRIKRAGTDYLIQLPAACVSEVCSVMIGDKAWTDFDCAPNGMLRLFDAVSMDLTRKTAVIVEYKAGIPDGSMPVILDLLSSRAIRGLSGTNGVSSESAGGVSISYRSNWVNSGGAGALQSTDMEILEPYKLREVF